MDGSFIGVDNDLPQLDTVNREMVLQVEANDGGLPIGTTAIRWPAV